MTYFAPLRLFSKTTMRTIKPDVISLAKFANGTSEDRQALASQILEAGSKTGFFYVTDWSGTSKGIRFLDVSAKYFNRKTKWKKRDTKEVKDGFTRGYLRIGSESGSPDLFERKEAFSYGFDGFNPPMRRKIGPSNSLEGQNVWPQNLRDEPEFNSA